MSTHPLTHHEILSLVEPFTRRERHVDLAASDRIERRLVFKPVERPLGESSPSVLQEILVLEQPKTDRYRLTRSLRHPGGLEGRLVVEGSDIGALLEHTESIAPTQHFRERPSFTIARSYRLETDGQTDQGQGRTIRLILSQGDAQMAGLHLTMKAQTGRGMPAELEVRAAEGDTLEMPEDMLAVIGWDWRRLTRSKQMWKSTLRLRGSEPDRSRDGEVKLTRTVEHLAETLSAPPARYHERLVAARWTVAFRRAIPLLIGVGMILGAPAIQFLELSEGSLLRMLIFHSPPLLMVLFFSMREMPRIEIPPFPKPLTLATWRQADATDGSDTTSGIRSTQAQSAGETNALSTQATNSPATRAAAGHGVKQPRPEHT
jgi:hypothetical protein